jgi:hypothetical protein
LRRRSVGVSISGVRKGVGCHKLALAASTLALSAATPASAQGIDFARLIAEGPSAIPDLRWNGITLIGAIDVSGQYESRGSPYHGDMFTSAGIIGPANRSPQWVFAPNQVLQSYIGVKVDEPIGHGIALVGRAEFGFNPTTLDVSDALKSLRRANGVPASQQYTSGDGTRAGQVLNGEAWGGIKVAHLGELRAGRNDTISLDLAGIYDPLLSYGFSLSGYVVLLIGQGSPETPRIDHSIKYLGMFGPIRVKAIYGDPGTDVKQFYQGSIGYVRPRLSVDVFGGHASDMMSATALSGPANLGSHYLGARVFDTAMYGVFTRFVFCLDKGCAGGEAGSSLSFTSGYQHLAYSNPADGGFAPGHRTIGGYEIGPALSTTGAPGAGIVNYSYAGGDRLVKLHFLAAKYTIDPKWSVMTGYYRFDQNGFGYDVNRLPGIQAPSYSNGKCSSKAFFNCSGSEDVASVRTDFKWSRNIILYGGVTYSRVRGGFAFGYLATSTVSPTLGVRLVL